MRINFINILLVFVVFNCSLMKINAKESIEKKVVEKIYSRLKKDNPNCDIVIQSIHPKIKKGEFSSLVLNRICSVIGISETNKRDLSFTIATNSKKPFNLDILKNYNYYYLKLENVSHPIFGDFMLKARILNLEETPFENIVKKGNNYINLLIIQDMTFSDKNSICELSKNINTLQAMVLHDIKNLESCTQIPFEKLQALSISRCKDFKNINIPTGHKLKILCLSCLNTRNISEVQDNSINELYLINMQKLSYIDLSKFKNLKFLYIENCPLLDTSKWKNHKMKNIKLWRYNSFPISIDIDIERGQEATE